MTIEATPTHAELLCDYVPRWARDTPDAVAITYGEQTWTWSQWNHRIRSLTGALRAAGITRGDVIGFLDKNHPACLETTFAAAAIGAAVTVVNWRQAGDELRHVLVDSGTRLLVVGAEFADEVARLRDQIPGLERLVVLATPGAADAPTGDDYESFLAAAAPSDRDAAVVEDDAALIIYSSGTTGRPKGVVLSQRALVAHTVNVADCFPFNAGDISLVAMPLFHLGGICYSFFGIRAGVATIMTREPAAPALVGALMSGATHTFFVPPVIAGFLAAGPPAMGALSRLKTLGYGAAPMPLPLLRRALDACPDLDFVQVYGQTEVSGVATTLLPADHRDPAREHLLLSVGQPVAGMEVMVVDPVTAEPVAAGEQGEIWCRSAQSMTGYLNRPDATAETVTAQGWVRTGDIGRVDADGYVFVDDRIKDMIITGGENVYGPEVERVLLDHPDVSDAAIIGVPDDTWGESVKAVVVAPGDVDVEGIIAFCRERLAGYKCPRTVDVVAALPRNPSGKILKRELRAGHWVGRDRAV
ncbi:AMP-binding protein [Williamsia sp. CHRR-6]|uniref:AMP-binding protein n=1 Tax=Williamsia sp. CHRR-6 TaxID=2835871 RepID=UPI001BDAFE07|nr:AMP-binding protein [Williamsia sp. CHRR-6]MBT0566373.1 AMP-binding protein [Williamsia sp. CHRR-6]